MTVNRYISKFIVSDTYIAEYYTNCAICLHIFKCVYCDFALTYLIYQYIGNSVICKRRDRVSYRTAFFYCGYSDRRINCPETRIIYNSGNRVNRNGIRSKLRCSTFRRCKMCVCFCLTRLKTLRGIRF